MATWRTFGERLNRAFFPASAPAVPASRQANFSAVFPVDQLLLHMQGRIGNGAVTREQALAVPAVQQGLRMIGQVATLPLQVYRIADREIVDNALMRQIDPDVPNVITIKQTIDDLVFEGIAWWLVTARDFSGFPISARHVDVKSVTVQEASDRRSPSPLPSGIDPRGSKVFVDGVEVSWADLIRFDSPNPPLLVAGASAIRLALALMQTAELYARNPRPLDYLTPAEHADDISDEDAQGYVNDWERRRQTHTTGWLPPNLAYNTVDSPTPQQLQLNELMQQVTISIANSMGVDPDDLGVAVNSETYQNAQDRRQDRINSVHAPHMRAITDRLSMGDVTRRGYEVRFNLSDFLKSNPTEQVAYWKALKDMGVMDAAEIRAAAGLSGPPPEPEPQPEPAQPEDQGEEVEASADVVKFSSLGELVTFDIPTQNFSVDRESRTITGLVAPYGQKVWHEETQKFWQFERGSFTVSDTGRVKLLRDHDIKQPLGRAVELTETDSGLMAKFSVAPGVEGDRALELAMHGTLDGLSVGVGRGGKGRVRNGAFTPQGAPLREVSLTAVPAFDDSRLTSVTASLGKGNSMPDEPEQNAPAAPASPETPNDQAAQFAAFVAWQAAQSAPEPERPTVVNPTRPVAATFVNEALPYRFSRQPGRTVFAADAEHDFSTDLIEVVKLQRAGMDYTVPQARANALIAAAFADVERADVTALNPNRQRPDLWQPQMDYATPLWDMVNSGPTDGKKFDIPKFTSSSGLVVAATEKTEPAGGSLVVEAQTITPTQVWGKAEITRQAWRDGGSPQMSGILWDQMLREYFEDREAAVATFLNTLTAATDITLPGVDASPDNTERLANAAALERAIAQLQFVRGGNRFRAFAVHEALFLLLAAVTDTAGRPLYPILNPQNANGTAESLYSTLNIAGVRAVGAYALGAAGGNSSVNSWLFDPAKVRGWASTPERLFWDFGSTVQTANIPQLSFVTVGIYGDIAFGNTDINGVRQVIFDQNTAA